MPNGKTSLFEALFFIFVLGLILCGIFIAASSFVGCGHLQSVGEAAQKVEKTIDDVAPIIEDVGVIVDEISNADSPRDWLSIIGKISAGLGALGVVGFSAKKVYGKRKEATDAEAA